eukprot:512088-Pleurochrysis_carterae.AAC.1
MLIGREQPASPPRARADVGTPKSAQVKKATKKSFKDRLALSSRLLSAWCFRVLEPKESRKHSRIWKGVGGGAWAADDHPSAPHFALRSRYELGMLIFCSRYIRSYCSYLEHVAARLRATNRSMHPDASLRHAVTAFTVL